MGIGALFNSASSSLAAQRVALDVTGQNIANVNTDGYSRQRVILESAQVTTHNGFPLGSGVNVASVQRVYDAILNRQINDGSSLMSNNQSKLNMLKQIEPYLNELSGNSIGDAMQGLSDAWQSLSLNPAGISERQTVLGKAQVLVDTFHQVSDGLVSSQVFADTSLTAVTSDVTSKAREIANLNVQIKSSELSSGNANELRDRRDLLLQQISSSVSVTYTERSNGTIDVNLLGGEALVSDNTYATLYTDPGAGGVTSNTIRITALGDPPATATPAFDTNVTATIGGSNNSKGEIGGLLTIRDSSIPNYLDKLDELAYNLAYQTNTQHTAGWNLNNATGVAFFTPGTVTPPPAGSAVFSGYSSSIKVALSNTNDIAAADASPLTSGIGNNKNALIMAGLSNKQVTFSGGAMATTADYYSSLVAGVGVDVQSAKNMTAQNQAFVQQLGNLRDSNSGVSLDEELTNLIKYQKAFEGASKVITTAAQMLDTVMGLIR